MFSCVKKEIYLRLVFVLFLVDFIVASGWWWYICFSLVILFLITFIVTLYTINKNKNQRNYAWMELIKRIHRTVTKYKEKYRQMIGLCKKNEQKKNFNMFSCFFHIMLCTDTFAVGSIFFLFIFFFIFFSNFRYFCSFFLLYIF